MRTEGNSVSNLLLSPNLETENTKTKHQHMVETKRLITDVTIKMVTVATVVNMLIHVWIITE